MAAPFYSTFVTSQAQGGDVFYRIIDTTVNNDEVSGILCPIGSYLWRIQDFSGDSSC